MNGNNLYAGIRYKPDKTLSLYGQVDYLDRFNEEDVRLLVGGSRRFSGEITLSGEMSLTPEAELYPRVSGWAELAYPLFSSFVIYSSVNLSNYRDIDLFGVSLAGEYYPVGNLALIGRITFSETEFDTGDSADDTSFMMKGTWFFTDDYRMSLYYSYGNESYKVETIDSVGDVEAKTYGISGLYFFTPMIGIAPSIEFQDRERGVEYLQFGLELRYRT
jgi:YaiO family outer membrane protein